MCGPPIQADALFVEPVSSATTCVPCNMTSHVYASGGPATNHDQCGGGCPLRNPLLH